MKSKLFIILSMLIFGTIGLLTRSVGLPSSFLAFIRGVIGVIFIIISLLIIGKKIDFKSIKANLPILAISGGLVGLNWIFLFEAYNNTSIAIATITYYLAPIFVIILTPIILKEKISSHKIICIIIALIGMVLVSNVLFEKGNTSFVGIAFGTSAAICYSLVMILNKFLKNISGINSTIAQLSFSAITILPYILLTEDFSTYVFSQSTIILIIILGIVHTGIAYLLYFTSMLDLKSTEIALFSYIDPVSAIILSTFILLEPIALPQIIGVVLVLLATALSDLIKPKHNDI